MKKRFGAVIYISIIILSIILLNLPMIILHVGYSLSEGPAKPKVKKGEFPFKLVYEMDGEVTTIEDTLVIKYKGIRYTAMDGKYIHWDYYYKNGSIDESDKGFFNQFTLYSEDDLSIRFELGPCGYYMGTEYNLDYYQSNGINMGDIIVDVPNETYVISEEELHDKYGIEIIEKYISEPIIQSQDN